jgi:hypothetical protein
MQPAEHLGLVVGLAHLDVEAEFRAEPGTAVGQLGVRRHAVHVDLAAAEAAQVRAVEHVHLHA